MKKFFSGLIKYESLFATLILIAICMLAFTQVCTRYIFKVPTPWIEETTRYLMIWMIFLGWGLCAAKREHLQVDLADLILSKDKLRVLTIALDAVVIIFGIFFTYISAMFTYNQMIIGQLSPAMQLPITIVYLALPIGGVLFTIYSIFALYEVLGAGKSGE